jgi:hypothetical protein
MVKLAGVEFEGCWRGESGISPYSDVSIKHDGSVRNSVDRETNREFVHYGEIVSPPLEPEELIRWARKHVPHGVNKTCGTHVHVSFDEIQKYAACVQRKFFNSMYTMFEELMETLDDEEFCAALKRRMKGNMTYTAKRFVPSRQLIVDYNDDRYTAINYCWNEHGTFEIRLLPGVTNPDTIEKVLRAIFRWIEEHVEKNKFKKKFRFRR